MCIYIYTFISFVAAFWVWRYSFFSSWNFHPKSPTWLNCPGWSMGAAGSWIAMTSHLGGSTHQLRLVYSCLSPLIYQVFIYIPGGCLGFLPSTDMGSHGWVTDPTTTCDSWGVKCHTPWSLAVSPSNTTKGIGLFLSLNCEWLAVRISHSRLACAFL